MISVMNSCAIWWCVPSPPQRRNARVSCCASNSNMKNTDLLRTQLHQLHSEAETTRDKASNARLRLMRLSEAATKLQRQAATDVRVGKENEARDLLVQKRKVMQALEKSKSRVEMFDKLLAKLNEAISVKETQLIGNVSSGLDVGRENVSSDVRIISPKDDSTDIRNEVQEKESSLTNHMEDYMPQSPIGYDASTMLNHQKEDTEAGSTNMESWNEPELVNSLKNISSYEEFLKHLDKQLTKVEVDLVTFLRLSNLVLEGKEKPENSKVQQAQEILENICRIRKRIVSITKIEAKTN